jgi:hypothetical protein
MDSRESREQAVDGQTHMRQSRANTSAPDGAASINKRGGARASFTWHAPYGRPGAPRAGVCGFTFVATYGTVTEARRAKRDAACPSQADDDALTGQRRRWREMTGWVFAAEAPMAMRMGPLGEVHALSAARDRTRRMTST